MEAKILKLSHKCKECQSDDIPLYNLKKAFYLCKDCTKKKAKKRYLENREAYLHQASGRYKSIDRAYGTKAWAQITRAGLKYFDREKNKHPICDISNEDLFEIIKKPCSYCDDSIDRIGVDRIDNEIGHIKTNLVPSCYSCNQTRLEKWSHEEMKILGKAIAEIKARRRRT
jgi:hypothetical protein